MKSTFRAFLLVLLLPLFSLGQKAKQDKLNCSYKYMYYPTNLKLSSHYFVLTVTEQSSCQGLIPYKVMRTPYSGLDQRANFYLGLVPQQNGFFAASKDLLENSVRKEEPITHIEINASDIVLRNQSTGNAKTATDQTPNRYFFVFDASVNVSCRISRVGDMNQLILDTNSANQQRYAFQFPMNVQLAQSVDFSSNGFATEGQLIAAWKKYGKEAERQWRDKIISDYLKNVLFDYKQTYIQCEKYDVCRVISDKNKKGGYDEIVQAAALFQATMKEINTDYENKVYSKYWTVEYQNRLKSCLETWKAFLDQDNFDVTVEDNLIDAEYRQDILINYIQGLMFTGQFNEAHTLIDHYSRQSLKSSKVFELEALKRFCTVLEQEFSQHATSMNWVRLSDL